MNEKYVNFVVSLNDYIMNVEAKKLSLIEQLMFIRNESTLQRFEELLNQAKKEDKANAMSLDQYNDRIDKALERVESGQFTTQEDLEIQVKEW